MTTPALPCPCGALRSDVDVRCPDCGRHRAADAAFVQVRLIQCACGVRRAGNDRACPACGAAGGAEIVIRRRASLAEVIPDTFEPALVERTAPVAAPAEACHMCGTPRERTPAGILLLCPVCDVPVAAA